MTDTNRSILITGASGQLGRCLSDVKPPGITIYELSKRDFDIADPDQIDRIFEKYNFEFCVNCAAFTGVDLAESNRAEAYEINAEAVRLLAKACNRYDKTLIHISTDYVYDDGISRPLLETNPTAPKSVYAASKLKGDAYAIEENPKTIVLRTSWLYSEYGKNFVKTMLQLGRKRNELHVVADQHGIPTYARDLANAIFQIVQADLTSSAYGVYHFANTGATTWRDFAQAIFDKSGLSVTVVPIQTEDYPTPARRPMYSVLDSTKFAKQFSFELRHWQDALDECLSRIAFGLD